MSNTKKAEFYNWDDFVAEAEKPPFKMNAPGGKTIVINEPTGQQLINAQNEAARGDVEEQLRTICGDATDEVLPLIKAGPGGAMGKFIQAVMKHFGYDTPDVGEAAASSS